MGRRKERRTEARLGVKLWGTDASGRPFIETVTTRNVSREGVLLEGVQHALKPGDSVGLTYNKQKIHCRVTWVGEPGTPQEGLAGLENAVREQCVWDVPLPAPGPDLFVQQPSARADRRQFPRFRCQASVELRIQSSGAPLRGNLADISLGGCYIEMMIPLPVGTRLDLVVWLGVVKLATAGMVTSSHAGFGIGVKFIGMGRPERQQLQEFLAQPAQTSRAEVGTAKPRFGPSPSGSEQRSPQEIKIER